MALMHRPDLLVLDEPTSGLDPLMQREFEAVAREIVAEGRTVFLSSHELDEVQRWRIGSRSSDRERSWRPTRSSDSARTRRGGSRCGSPMPVEPVAVRRHRGVVVVGGRRITILTAGERRRSAAAAGDRRA